MIRIARIALLTLTLSGCASTLSGVGGTQQYACKAPIGALCTSVSGVYANALRGMAEVPRPPLTMPAPTMLGDASGATKVTSPFDRAKPLTGLTSPSPARIGSQTKSATAIVATSQPDGPPPGAEPALRSEPRVLRLWIAPWEDSDGDLHDASFVHVVIDTGRWLIERVRPMPRNRLDKITPPTAMATPQPMPADLSPQITPAQPSADPAMPSPDSLPVEP